MALIPSNNGVPKNTIQPETPKPVKIVTEPVKSVKPAQVELKQTKNKK